MRIVAKGAILPYGYTKVQYIQSSGTQQIDTGVLFNMNTYKCEVDFQSTVSSQNGMIFANSNTTNHFWFYHYKNSGKIDLYIQNSGSQIGINGPAIDLNRHVMKYENKTYYMDGVSKGSDSRTLGTTDTNIYLFSWGNAYYYSGKIYSCKIWNGSSLIRNFVPCYRDSDRTVGLFDTVQKKFYKNSGTGSFSYGPQIYGRYKPVRGRTPYIYKEVEYLESTGTQYIDTGYSNSEGFAAEIKFMLPSIPSASNGYMIGCHNLSDPYGRNGFHPYYGQWQLGHGDVYPVGGTPLANTLYYGDVDTKKGAAYLKINGETVITDSGSTTLSNLNVLLFTDQYVLTYQGTTLPAKVYSCKIYAPGKTQLVRNFVPVVRISDGKPGMYDSVSKAFYTNAGSGEFKYGDKVGPKRTVAHSIVAKGIIELEYIQSSGTQYINTGVPGETGVGVEMDFMLLEKTTSGSKDLLATNNPKTYFFHQYNGTCGMGYNGTYYDTPLSYDANLKYHLECYLFNNTQSFKLNGNTKTWAVSGSYTSSYPLFLFARNNGGNADYQTSAKVYNCQIYQNGNLLRDFVPAKRISGGAIGMYDKVNGVFYENNGSGAFVAGPAIK